MVKAKLILQDGTEIRINGTITSIGRTSDNDVPLAGDTNISRYHAEIEDRGEGDFWLLDLDSSNGTSINGDKITESPLHDGDEILIGGSSAMRFLVELSDEPEEEEEEEETEEPDAESQPETTPEVPAQSKKFLYLLVFAAIAIGLGVILAVAAGLYYLTGDSTASTVSECSSTAEIISPENGDILSETTSVEIEIEDAGCVAEAIFVVGDKEFGRAKDEPFKVSLDPDKFPGMSDGRDRKISIILIDAEGNKIPQDTEIAISIETIEAEESETPGSTGPPTDGPPVDGPPTDTVPAKASLIDTQKMTQQVVPQFTRGGRQYNTNNQQFLAQVAKMTAEYVDEGFYARASKYRDVINYQYQREQNLDPPIGYILAMSRTKFRPVNRADGAGLWRMNNQLVLDNAYNGICGAETIASETQKCAAIASSSYLKDIILNVFNGDVIYGVAAFGMDKQEASAWNASLPADRSDFWNVIRDPKRREEVVRFFAAAVVLENPQKFGLRTDKPISTLYPAYAE